MIYIKLDLETKGLDKRFQQGVNFYNQGKHKEAAQSFKKSLKKNPQYLPTYINLTHVYLNLGQYHQLINTLQINYKKNKKERGVSTG